MPNSDFTDREDAPPLLSVARIALADGGLFGGCVSITTGFGILGFAFGFALAAWTARRGRHYGGTFSGFAVVDPSL